MRGLRESVRFLFPLKRFPVVFGSVKGNAIFRIFLKFFLIFQVVGSSPDIFVIARLFFVSIGLSLIRKRTGDFAVRVPF